ncbi:MAG: GlsB/YeaQ/YmgE family stress response membrane protein [Phototrophicaceae bacterium]
MSAIQMSWLAWLIVGAVSGWLASMVMRTNRQQGLLMDIVVGILGAFVGGFLFNQFGSVGVTGFNVWSVFVAFVGAVVLLGLIRLFTGRGALAP